MIIGLIGFKQVGKSTAAEHLQKEHGFTRHNMKDALVKEMKENLKETLEAIKDVHSLGGCPRLGMEFKYTTDPLFKEKPPVMRALMQNYGTDVRRKDSDSYWTDKWQDTLEKLGTADVVVDDVRFLNEATTVKEAGGFLIRLTRPDMTTGGEHVSETEQLGIKEDFTIDAKFGDQESLYEQLDTFIETMKAISTAADYSEGINMDSV